VEPYQRLYARKYAPSDYRREVFTLVEELRKKYGIGAREKKNEHEREPESARSPEQAMLEWTP